MNTTYCITNYENRLCGCLLKDGRLFQLQLFSDKKSILGNIYVGKVKNIVKNIDAAFVEIGDGQTCFLPLSEAEFPVLTNRVYDNRIIAGDEILVQVKKEAVKTKDPVLTARLTFQGRYAAVIVDGRQKLNYSHKIEKADKKMLSEVLKSLSLPENISIIIRTEAAELTEYALLTDEISGLLNQAENILRIGKTRTVFSRLNAEIPSFIRMMEELPELPDKIITDIPSVHAQLYSYLRDIDRNYADRLVLYQDSMLSLSNLYGLNTKIEDAFKRNIWLKSGGYLVIEPTEALTVIDVNTGKFSGKKEPSETFLRINMEAAEEIARQLQLRNISGIIVVDFINMENKEQDSRLMVYFADLLKNDPVTARLIDMTPLGLVEITRKKVHMSLQEQLKTI